MLPDLLAFGPHFASSIWDSVLGMPSTPVEPKYGYANVPGYIFAIYDVTHSLVVFLASFFIVWALRKRPLWSMAAWGLHILMDIPTHNTRFFPTPFLWPLSAYVVDGIPWTHPIILLPDVILLVLLFSWRFSAKRKSR